MINRIMWYISASIRARLLSILALLWLFEAGGQDRHIKVEGFNMYWLSRRVYLGFTVGAFGRDHRCLIVPLMVEILPDLT